MLRDVNKTESVPRPDYAQVKGHIFIVQIKNRTQAYYLGMLESHHVARIKLTIIFIDTILLPMMFVYRFLEKHWLGMDRTLSKSIVYRPLTLFLREILFFYLPLISYFFNVLFLIYKIRGSANTSLTSCSLRSLAIRDWTKKKFASGILVFFLCYYNYSFIIFPRPCIFRVVITNQCPQNPKISAAPVSNKYAQKSCRNIRQLEQGPVSKNLCLIFSRPDSYYIN